MQEILRSLFERGLGEFLVLHLKQSTSILGRITYDKGNLVIRDSGYLVKTPAARLAPVWQSGILGMISSQQEREWKSLTFSGVNHCSLKAGVDEARHSVLGETFNDSGEDLLNFNGSIYRGYQLMLDNNYLPVIMLRTIESIDGYTGLAVCDLRAAPVSLHVIQSVNEAVRQSAERHRDIEVKNIELERSEFEMLFEEFLH